MNDLMPYLPLLDLLVVPVFLQYVNIQVRLAKLEIHQGRIMEHIGLADKPRVDL